MSFKKCILLMLISMVGSIALMTKLCAIGHPIKITDNDELCGRIVPYTFESNTTGANSVVIKVGYRCRVEFAVRHGDQTPQFLGSRGDLWADYELQIWNPDPTPAPLVNVFQKRDALNTCSTNKTASIIYLDIVALNPGQTTLVFSIKPIDGISVCKTYSINITINP